jgi:hypothetical protein
MEENLKITEKLAFLTPAVRYTLKSLTEYCRILREQFLIEKPNGFQKGCSCTDPFCLKLLIEK